ncbi:receptor-type tyrosine-protein phosphatase eta-like isoform X2 [Hyperolius riggenbachi]
MESSTINFTEFTTKSASMKSKVSLGTDTLSTNVSIQQLLYLFNISAMESTLTGQQLGNCSADSGLCCMGRNDSCFRGCFCDEACIQLHDCCSDYGTTCKQGTASTSTVELSTILPTLYFNTTSTKPITVQTTLNVTAGTASETSTVELSTILPTLYFNTTSTKPITVQTTLNVTAVPGQVKNLTISNVSTTSISLSWEKPDGNVSAYFIQVLGAPSYNKTVTATATIIEGLTPGNVYIFLVYAFVDNKTGEMNSISAYTLPESVTNLTVEIVNLNSVQLSWRAPIGNKSSYIITDVANALFKVQTLGESIVIGNLTAGMKYQFMVSVLAGENTVQGIGKQILVYTNQASLYISCHVSTMSKLTMEQQILLQINQVLQGAFPNKNITAALKAERTS